VAVKKTTVEFIEWLLEYLAKHWKGICILIVVLVAIFWTSWFTTKIENAQKAVKAATPLIDTLKHHLPTKKEVLK
jgi:hypothetical protein